MSVISIENVSKTFGKQVILDAVNVEINMGELVHIVGGNGCGKSTLFKLICDILEPDSGSIHLSEEVHLGALIENPGFIEHSTIRTNLKFLGDINHNYNEERIVQLCQKFQLDFHSKQQLKKYSVGMRQKVGIIQAIMEDQNVILLDEPTRGLDQDSLGMLYHLITDLVKEGKTVLIASHDNLAQLPFSRCLELKNGKMVEV